MDKVGPQTYTYAALRRRLVRRPTLKVSLQTYTYVALRRMRSVTHALCGEDTLGTFILWHRCRPASCGRGAPTLKADPKVCT